MAEWLISISGRTYYGAREDLERMSNYIRDKILAVGKLPRNKQAEN